MTGALARGNYAESTYTTDNKRLVDKVEGKDASGNLQSQKIYSYDNLQRSDGIISRIDSTQTVSVSYGYVKDRLKTISRGGQVYTLNYDNWGRSTSTQVGNQTLATNTYFALTETCSICGSTHPGLLKSVKYGNPGSPLLTVYYEYDDMDCVTKIYYGGTGSSNLRYSYVHDGEGNMYSQTMHGSNGVAQRTTYYEYDHSGRCMSSYTKDTGGLLSSYQYQYDANNSLKQLSGTIGNFVWRTEYNYDADNRPSSVIINAGGAGTKTISYSYDAIGRLTQRSLNLSTAYNTVLTYHPGTNGTATTGAQTALLKTYKNGSDTAYEYEYDAGGNIKKIKQGTTVIDYQYDQLNQLVREDNGQTQQTIAYKYDGYGNILEKIYYPYTTGVLNDPPTAIATATPIPTATPMPTPVVTSTPTTAPTATPTPSTITPINLGAADMVDGSAIRFGSKLMLAEMQAALEPGDAFRFGFYTQTKTAYMSGLTPAKTYISPASEPIIWTQEYDNAATGTALKTRLYSDYPAAGAARVLGELQIYASDATSITFALTAENMQAMQNVELVWIPFVEVNTVSTLGEAKCISIAERLAGISPTVIPYPYVAPTPSPTPAPTPTAVPGQSGTITIANYDADAPIWVYSATFGVYSDSICTNVVDEVRINDEYGRGHSNALPIPVGQSSRVYYVKQLTPPYEYQLNEETYEVEVSINENAFLSIGNYPIDYVFDYHAPSPSGGTAPIAIDGKTFTPSQPMTASEIAAAAQAQTKSGTPQPSQSSGGAFLPEQQTTGTPTPGQSGGGPQYAPMAGGMDASSVLIYTYASSGWKDQLQNTTDYNVQGNYLVQNSATQTMNYDSMGNPLNYKGDTLHWEGKRLMGIGTNISFSYDENGLRTSKIHNGNTTQYNYNGTQLMSMVYDGWATMLFSYDAFGQVVSVNYKDGNAAAVEYYYVRNGQGDIIKIIDGNGSTVVEYKYDTWGKLLDMVIPNYTGEIWNLGYLNPFRYRGYVYDTETSLYYCQSRYYDPEVGRFLNADAYLSTGQGVLGYNMYAYCLNNLVNRSDPSGMACIHLGSAPGPCYLCESVAWAAAQAASTGAGAPLTPNTKSPVDTQKPPDHPNYKPPKKGGGKKVRDPNGRGYGWLSADGTIWIPKNDMDGGPGWEVQEPGGGHSHAYPGGGTRVHSVWGVLEDAIIEHHETDMAIGKFVHDTVTSVFTAIDDFFTELVLGCTGDSLCFTGDTLIKTDRGLVQIMNVKVGDLVYSYDSESGKRKYKRVTKLFCNSSNQLVYISIDGEIIKTTLEHPFYVENVGWMRAGDLEQGDTLKLSSRNTAIVENIEQFYSETPITVYNFEVEDYHTYFVSKLEVLVHNRCQ